jgi:hypothetical protein
MANSPENDVEKPAATTDGQQKEKYTPGTPIKFRPPAFMQNLLRRYQERYGAQHKQWYKQYIVQPTLSAWQYLYARWTRRVQQVALAIGALIFLWLWNGDRMDSDTVVAVFTIVLTYTAWYSWQAMREQNRIMLRQMKQTDAMIDQMRLDNRAWLAVHNVQIQRLQKGYNKLQCTVLVRNSGKTPGRIFTGCIRHYVRPKDSPTDPIIAEFESEPDDRPHVYVAHPNEIATWEMAPLGSLGDGVIEAVRIGDLELHILVRFRYRFIGGDVDEEKAFFTSVAAGPEMRRRGNYCAVHEEIGFG